MSMLHPNTIGPWGLYGRSLQRVLPLLALLPLLAGGCSNLDFSRGPLSRISDVVNAGEPFVPDDTEAIEQERRERLEKVLEEWRRQADEQSAVYRIGVNDVLAVQVFALAEPGKWAELQLTVQDDGAVMLPLAGRVEAAGATTGEVRQRVALAYTGRYLKDPQVKVDVAEYRSAAVVLTGEVQRPGVYFLERRTGNVLELLFRAGGLSSEAGDYLYILRTEEGHESVPVGVVDAAGVAETGGGAAVRTAMQPSPEMTGQRKIAVDLAALIDRGDAFLNLPIKAGDVITVPPRAKKYVYVMGYAKGSRAIPLERGRELSALNALALAGGPAAMARADKSFLIRETPKGNQIVKIDLIKIARGVRPDVDLKAGDTLVVGSGPLLKLMEIFRVGGGATVSYSENMATTP